MNGMGLVVICFFCGLSAGIIGRWKGSSFWLWFAIGFFIPILGTIAALLWRYEDDEAYRECGNCVHVMPPDRRVCNLCGTHPECYQEVLSTRGYDYRGAHPMRAV